MNRPCSQSKFARHREVFSLVGFSALGVGVLLHPASAVAQASGEAKPTTSAVVDLGEAPKPKIASRAFSLSADFLLGQGHVALPSAFAMSQSPQVLALIPTLTPEVVSPDRKSASYYGATLSYAFNPRWQLEASYAQGSTDGTVALPILRRSGNDNASFQMDDSQYQLFLRYSPDWLQRGRFSSFFRLGATYGQSDQTTRDLPNSGDRYNQEAQVTDYAGNVGFGTRMSLFTKGRQRLALSGELEVFAGVRQQDFIESSPAAGILGISASADNMIYGGMGRLVLRYDVFLGSARNLRLTLDAGVQGKVTFVNYSQGLGTHDELLWGPFAKLGLRYSF